MAKGLKNVQLVKVGKWKASTGEYEFTTGDLEELVTTFRGLNSKNGFRPHLKLGHTEAQKFFGQRSGFPSLGEVTRVWRDGDSVYGDIENVPEPLLDLIEKRRYTQLSIELIPSYEYEGATYKNVLVGVALLGAELPAVKGLADLASSLFREDIAQFKDASGKLELSDMPAPATGEKTAEVIALEARLAAAEQAQKDATAANAALLQRIEASENAGRTAAIEAAVDGAIEKGRLLPKHREAAIALGASIDQKVKIKFGEGDKATEKTGVAAFAQFLSDLPEAVALSERGLTTADDTRTAEGEGTAADQLNAKAQKLVADGKKKDFAEAFATVMADPANAELKTRYALGR